MEQSGVCVLDHNIKRVWCVIRCDMLILCATSVVAGPSGEPEAPLRERQTRSETDNKAGQGHTEEEVSLTPCPLYPHTP